MTAREGELVLITGGVRSGKSRHALQLVRRAGVPTLFVATAVPCDDELRERIDRHREERPHGWRTAEALEGPLAGYMQGSEDNIILDCLTLYVGRRVTEEVGNGEILREVEEALEKMLSGFELAAVVTNEVGLGVIPENQSARRFSEVLGTANRLVAEKATEILLMLAGFPVKVK